MTPKERANFLVDKHLKLCVEKDYHQDFKLIQAKRGALIAVDEVIYCLDINHDNVYFYNSEYEYYKEIKQEIDKL